MKKLLYTPNSRIKQALRVLWLRSRERSQALQHYDYRCSVCSRKQSKAKGRELALEVHHLDGLDWAGLYAEIRRRLLVSPDRLAPLCKECHEKMHEQETGGKP